MTSDTRPIWLTEDMAICSGLKAAWHAAPADATEAVRDTLYRQHLGGVWRGDESTLVAAAILAALGCAPPTTKDTT